MYNFVKLSQNQLQPSYNRRKYNHSHYNQTLKERTRLNRIYAYLSKPTIKSYCAFTIKPTSSTYSLQNMAGSLKVTPESLENKTPFPHNAGLNVHSLLNNYSKARPTNPQMTYHRPIPKIVNFLESRLDIILWKNQFANSIKSARQTLRQGILVNGGLQKKSSFQTLPGDVFTFIK
jgi:ribosomal protein S4